MQIIAKDKLCDEQKLDTTCMIFEVWIQSPEVLYNANVRL